MQQLEKFQQKKKKHQSDSASVRIPESQRDESHRNDIQMDDSQRNDRTVDVSGSPSRTIDVQQLLEDKKQLADTVMSLSEAVERLAAEKAQLSVEVSRLIGTRRTGEVEALQQELDSAREKLRGLSDQLK